MGTVSQQPNTNASVYPSGSSLLEVQFETYVGSGAPCDASSVTIGITATSAPDNGLGTPVPTTGSGIVNQGLGLFSYTWNVSANQSPGTYEVTWAGTRASDAQAVEYQQIVTVVAPPVPAPEPGLYCSVTQYQNWSGDLFTPVSVVKTKLWRATEIIDVALVGAVYHVDANGMPADAALANVLVRATAAQCQFLIANNDDANVKTQYINTSVGGITLTREQSMTALALPPVAPQALAILRVAGILPAAPLVNW